jgi:CHAD domain-containing protein
MAFVVRPDKRIGEELLKVARQELRRAAASLRGAAASSKVHDARKRVKKVRAVVKLLSGARKGPWTKSGQRLRAAGRLLSDLRDMDALVETLDELRTRYPKRLSAASYRAIRRQLTRRRVHAMTEASGKRHLKSAAEKLEKVRRAAKKWHAPSMKASELPGLLSESFRASRKAMNIAARKKKPEAVHDWRKRVKTLWYHLRLVMPLAPDVGHRIRSLRSLERLLGEDHNLEVLCVTMAEDQDGDRQLTTDRRELILVARTRQSVVRRQAFALGKRLNAMTSKRFARSVRLH